MDNTRSWLPEKFLQEMQTLLGSEYEAFLASYDNDHYRGIRCNTLKVTPDVFEKKVPFVSGKVSWTENGYYTNEEEQPAKHPYYFAGLYYIQEPSAMLPAALLDVRPGRCLVPSRVRSFSIFVQLPEERPPSSEQSLREKGCSSATTSVRREPRHWLRT